MADLELYYEMRNIIKAGNLEKIKQIINNCGLSYLSAWDYGYQLLREACLQNHSHLAEYLLSKNVKINCDYAQVSPLQAAVMKNNKKLVKLLLEHGAKAYTNINKAPLQIAIERKNFEIAKILFEHNAVNKNIHELSDTPEDPALHLAVLSGEYSMVKLLLENGFNVNLNDSKGSKPIHLAIKLRLLSIVQLLLEFDADVNAKTKEGYTPHFLTLYLSQNRFMREQNPISSEQDAKILKLLLDYNADINIVAPNNYTTLYYSISYFRKSLFFIFWDENNLRRIEALISQIVKLKSQNLYISAGNLQEFSSIKIDRFVRYRQMCQEELLKMVNEKIPNTTISLYDFITKSDNYLASFVKNDNIEGFVLSDTLVNRYPIYASTVKNYFSRGVRRNFLLEESMKIFKNNWPYASNLLSNCLVCVFASLSNNDLHEFIWMFK